MECCRRAIILLLGLILCTLQRISIISLLSIPTILVYGRCYKFFHIKVLYFNFLCLNFFLSYFFFAFGFLFACSLGYLPKLLMFEFPFSLFLFVTFFIYIQLIYLYIHLLIMHHLLYLVYGSLTSNPLFSFFSFFL